MYSSACAPPSATSTFTDRDSSPLDTRDDATEPCEQAPVCGRMCATPTLVRRCVAYVRVSTGDQAREGVSLDAQTDRLRAYALAQGLGEVELCSEARTGKSIAHRPALQGLLDDVRAGHVSVVLVFKLNRLARNTIQALELARILQEHDCRLVSLSETIDTGSAFGTFFYTVLAALAQMERDQISENTRMALAHMARQGARLGSAPTGWRKVRGRDGKETLLAPDPAGQVLLLQIRALLSQGCSLRQVADRLTGAGVPTPRGASQWNTGTLSKILRRASAVACRDDRLGNSAINPAAASFPAKGETLPP